MIAVKAFLKGVGLCGVLTLALPLILLIVLPAAIMGIGGDRRLLDWLDDRWPQTP